MDSLLHSDLSFLSELRNYTFESKMIVCQLEASKIMNGSEVDLKMAAKLHVTPWELEALVENRESFLEWWQKQIQGEDLLAGYRAEKFMEYTDGVEPLVEMDTNFMLKTLDHIKVFEDGVLVVVFLDGTEIECK